MHTYHIAIGTAGPDKDIFAIKKAYLYRSLSSKLFTGGQGDLFTEKMNWNHCLTVVTDIIAPSVPADGGDRLN